MSAVTRIEVPGKWVLAGEHAVLRGGTAVAAPHPEFRLTLEFDPDGGGEGLGIDPLGGTGAWIREALEELLGSSALPSGRLSFSSSIPAGAGLGSSAALCVALARWLAPRLKWSPGDQRAAATRLEDHFHGKSSGMDIAACSASGPVRFTREDGGQPLALAAQGAPRFEFHDTGLRMSTREAVAQVEARNAAFRVAGQEIDRRMSAAAELAALGLERGEWDAVAQAMNAAQACFEWWGLVPKPVHEQIAFLRSRGALAVKLTGAGGGGFLVCLQP